MCCNLESLGHGGQCLDVSSLSTLTLSGLCGAFPLNPSECD